MSDARRGEIWVGSLDPVIGREQSGRRPLLVVSDDLFNRSAAELAVIVPLTTKEKGVPFHVAIDAPEGGLRERSFIKCEDVRSLSTRRLSERWGEVSEDTMIQVEDSLRRLLHLQA